MLLRAHDSRVGGWTETLAKLPSLDGREGEEAMIQITPGNEWLELSSPHTVCTLEGELIMSQIPST